MRFPSALCGVWSLVSSSNPQFLGSTMTVDFSVFKFSHYVKKYGQVSLNKNVYGSVYVRNSTFAKVLWSNKIDYTVESKFLPRIPVPWKTKCPRFSISFSLDDTTDQLTVVKANEKYVFQRRVVSLENEDNIYKIFITQLLFDLLLRHLPFMN